MKVVLNTCWAGPLGTFRPGEIADVNSEIAQELIDGGYAKRAPSKNKPKEAVEQPRKVGGRRGRASGLVGSGD